jgi:signal transduction histidine kinase
MQLTRSIRPSEQVFIAAQAATLVVCLGVAVAVSNPGEWPAGLVIALGMLGVSGVSGLRSDPEFGVNNASIAVIAAAVLIGPGVAVLIGTLVMVYDAIVFRSTLRRALTNVWAYALWPLAIGLAVDGMIARGGTAGGELAVIALFALIAGDFINFWLIALDVRVSIGQSLADSWRTVFVPVIPWLFVAAALASGLVLAYEAMGTAAIWGAVVLVVAQNVVLRAIVRGRDRGTELDVAQAEAERRTAEIETLAADRARLVDLMLGAEEAERKRLAELLHDSVLQELMIARQALAEDGTQLARADRALGEATEKLRASLAHLHPLMHEHIGLVGALEAVGELFPRLRALTVQVDETARDGRVDNRLLFWLARELLINALKHSQATTVCVDVDCVESSVRIRVEDDGVGMRPSQRTAELRHLGLALCTRRVEDAGGQFTLSVPPQGGTSVEIRLPIQTLPQRRGSPLDAAHGVSRPTHA